MNKEKALERIENLIQEGNNVLKTKRNSELGGTYVDSVFLSPVINHSGKSHQNIHITIFLFLI